MVNRIGPNEQTKFVGNGIYVEYTCSYQSQMYKTNQSYYSFLFNYDHKRFIKDRNPI